MKEELFFKNKLLNETEISQKKIVLTSMPRRFEIILTNRCNLKCIMCDLYKNPQDIPEKTLKEVIEYFSYLQIICWQGGEVFLLKYFEELFEKASMYPQLRQVIITNGLLIDEKWAKKLARKNVILTYSIDGATKRTYENIRKGARFEDLLKSINLVNRYKEKHNSNVVFSGDRMVTCINFVVMKSNYHEIEEILDFAKSWKFDALIYSPLKGILDSENIFLHRDLGALSHIEKIRPKLLKKAKKYKIHLTDSIPKIEVSKKVGTNDIANSKKILCYAPWQGLFIGPNNLRPRCFCLKDEGRVEKDSLKEVWNGKIMQEYRKKLLNNCFDWCDYRCTSGLISQERLKMS